MDGHTHHTHINIYDRSTLIGVVSGEPRAAWVTARTCVNSLAYDAGRSRAGSLHREWCRPRGRYCYERAGFRAVNTFRAVRRPDPLPEPRADEARMVSALVSALNRALGDS